MELKIIGYRDKVQLMNNFINVRLEAYNHNKTLNAIKHNIRHIQSKSQKLNFDNMSTDRVHNNSNFFIFSGVHYPMKKNKSDTLKNIAKKNGLTYDTIKIILTKEKNLDFNDEHCNFKKKEYNILRYGQKNDNYTKCPGR